MSWAEEKARLLLAHRLEKRRIWMSRSLAGIGAIIALLLTGLMANVVGVRYAASLRKEELQHQARMQILQHREDLYYQRQLAALSTVDSLYKIVFDSYFQVQYYYSIDSTSQQVMRYGEMMGSARNSLLDALHMNLPFVEDSLLAEMEKHAILFGAVRQLPVGKWSNYSSFFYWLQLNVSWRTSQLIRSALDSTKHDPSVPIFRVSDYNPPSFATESKLQYELAYLVENYVTWSRFADSVKVSRSQSKLIDKRK